MRQDCSYVPRLAPNGMDEQIDAVTQRQERLERHHRQRTAWTVGQLAFRPDHMVSSPAAVMLTVTCAAGWAPYLLEGLSLLGVRRGDVEDLDGHVLDAAADALEHAPEAACAHARPHEGQHLHVSALIDLANVHTSNVGNAQTALLSVCVDQLPSCCCDCACHSRRRHGTYIDHPPHARLSTLVGLETSTGAART